MRKPIEITFASKKWKDKKAALKLEGNEVYIYGWSISYFKPPFFPEEERHHHGPSLKLDTLEEWQAVYKQIYDYAINDRRSRNLEKYIHEMWKKAQEKNGWFSYPLEQESSSAYDPFKYDWC
ncbi:MAG: hypothetical protein IJZ59_04595 [Alphaproteobacteria bacterium]|nr:hypothetical protein [Alphaproteobacteria bacterium]